MQRFRADAVALFLFNFPQFTKIKSILSTDFLNQLRPLPLGTVLYALGPIIFSWDGSVFKIYRQSWSTIYKFFKYKFCKRRTIFWAAAGSASLFKLYRNQHERYWDNCPFYLRFFWWEKTGWSGIIYSHLPIWNRNLGGLPNLFIFNFFCLRYSTV